MDFAFYIENDHAVVSKCIGTDTEVIIPEQYNGFPVTKIANYCFFNRNITTVVGKSIKNIGTSAFRCCSSLTSINLPSCSYVGIVAFSFCTSLTSINLPVCTSIGSSAFHSCTNLTSVDLPACTSVGGEAFNDCISLTEINLPVCKYIGEYAFEDCKKLIKSGKYKATKIDLTCRDFKYEIDKWFEEKEAILCRKGFHYVENFYDIFNYYHGKLGEDLKIFVVEVEEISDEHQYDSKRVCKKIKLVNEIKSYQEVFKK